MTLKSLPFGIYILAREHDWLAAQEQGYWHTRALESEGFIHAASHEQVPEVYARRFSDCAHVCLLKLDEASLVDYIRWDPHPISGEPFPHITTVIPLASIERVIAWPL